ncbi:MAG: S53 family peptidase [Candidatus Acidiferrales bacterium]
MISRFRSVFFPAAALAAALTLYFGSAAKPADAGRSGHPRISQRIDNWNLVKLAGNTRPEANAENDLGPVPRGFPMEHMLLQLKRSPENEQALEAYLDQLSDHGSPNFHHWLTANEFGETYGVGEEALATVTDWLESQGFTVNVIYPSRMVIDFSGTASQVQAAFRTEIHYLDVLGARHIANMSDPRIPAALSSVVAGVVSLHDFLPHPMYKPRTEYTFTSGSTTNYAVVPGDLAVIYNLNPLFSEGYSGQGQTIVVIEDTNVYNPSNANPPTDWATFRSTFGLSVYTSGSFTQVNPAPPTGANNCTNPGTNGDDGEAILDAEYSSAAAPSAAIELASCADIGTTTFGGLIALQNILNESSAPPAIISISYGECEAENGATANAAYNSVYQQAAMEGVSVFVSSGDESAASCDANQSRATHGIGVSGFASTPYNVAVGGTDFGDSFLNANTTYWNSTNSSTYVSVKSYIPEIPWNDSCASALIASYEGYATTYGTAGYCNHGGPQTVVSGSGGPSGCATGASAVTGVVGGSCAGYAKPSWQSVFGNPSDGVRDIPDVSLFAANGVWGHYYPFCWSDTGRGGKSCAGAPSTWAGAGGTSFASPIMAGMQALVNQKWGAREGNPNPIYYMIAASEYGAGGNSNCNSSSQVARRGIASTCTFYDVTQGDIDVNCRGLRSGFTTTLYNCYLPSSTNGVLSTSNSAYDPAYGTTVGWDFATGIGTVNAYNLVYNTAWAP